MQRMRYEFCLLVYLFVWIFTWNVFRWKEILNRSILASRKSSSFGGGIYQFCTVELKFDNDLIPINWIQLNKKLNFSPGIFFDTLIDFVFAKS